MASRHPAPHDESMAQMGPMPPPPGEPTPRSGLDAFFGRLRGLPVRRDTEHKWAGGVCSGLATSIGIDPIVVRAGFVGVLIFGGAGLAMYLLALALIPDRNGRIWAEEAVRHGNGRGIFLLIVIVVDLADELRNRWWVWLVLPAALAGWWYLRRTQGQGGATTGRSATPRASGHDAPQGRPGWVGPPQRATVAPDVGTPAPAEPGHPAYPMAGTPGYLPTTAPAGDPGGAPHWIPPQGMPYGLGPGRTYVGVRPPKAPVVVRERRPSGGFAGFLLVLGLGIGAYGAGWSATREGLIRAPEVPFGLACAVGMIGVALVVKGLRGQRSRVIGQLAVLAALASFATVVVPHGISRYGTSIGDRSWAPSAGAADPGYRLGLGNARLDLSNLTAATADHQSVTASVGVGDLVLVVPETLTVVVDASIGVGNIEQRSGESRNTRLANADGADLREVIQIGAGEPDVIVTTTMGLGSMVIVRPAGAPTSVLTTAPPAVPSTPPASRTTAPPSAPPAGEPVSGASVSTTPGSSR